MVTYLKKKNLFNLWFYLKHKVHPDFYITEDNKRVLITEYSIFRRLLNQSHMILINKENNDINGVVMLWKGLGSDKKRSYIKINSLDESVARKLITVLLWNINENIYVKVKNYSPYIRLFKEKRFWFLGSRGKEFLLMYKYKPQSYSDYKRGNNDSRGNLNGINFKRY